MPTMKVPIARGPLVAMHRRNGATIELREGWEVAVRFPNDPAETANRVVDLSHRATFEINGPETDRLVRETCGSDVPLRRVLSTPGGEVYRLTPNRAILFGKLVPPSGALDVTGGWGTLALYGPQRERILNKITAVDLRERILPVGSCCQGPIFGVNTLFGRFEDRFELHVCSDSAEFFWEVLFDAGREFGLAPAGA